LALDLDRLLGLLVDRDGELAARPVADLALDRALAERLLPRDLPGAFVDRHLVARDRVLPRTLGEDERLALGVVDDATLEALPVLQEDGVARAPGAREHGDPLEGLGVAVDEAVRHVAEDGARRLIVVDHRAERLRVRG